MTWFAPCGALPRSTTNLSELSETEPVFLTLLSNEGIYESRDQYLTPTVQFQKESMTRDLTKKVLPTLLGPEATLDDRALVTDVEWEAL